MDGDTVSGEREQPSSALVRWAISSRAGDPDYASDRLVIEGTRIELTDAGGIAIWDDTGDEPQLVFAASPQHDWSIRVAQTVLENSKKGGILRRRQRSTEPSSEDED